MNFGASFATEEILYFLHADTTPPQNFTMDITKAIEQDFGAGCFMLSFDYNHWFLKANCWFTYLDNGIYRMQFIFFRIWLLYYLGYSQQYLLKLHKKLIRKMIVDGIIPLNCIANSNLKIRCCSIRFVGEAAALFLAQKLQRAFSFFGRSIGRTTNIPH